MKLWVKNVMVNYFGILVQKDISAQKLLQDVKNAPIGTDLSKKTHRKVTVSQDDTSRTHTVEQLMDELSVTRMLIRELGDRLSKLEKPWVGLSNGEMIELSEMELDSWDLILEVEAKLKEKNNG